MDCETQRVVETKRESKKEFDGFILWSCSLSSRYLNWPLEGLYMGSA